MKYDIIIIGAGPCGVQSALYTLRAGLETLVIDSGDSALLRADKIENYYGTGSVSGRALFESGLDSLRKLGCTVVNAQALGAVFDGAYTVKSTDGEYESRALLIASGSKRQKPPIADFDSYLGKGASYCAVCDGFFFRKKDVAVLGSGEYALSEARELKNICNKVTVLTDGEKITADFSEFEVVEDKNLQIIGDERIEGVTTSTGTLMLSGLFAAIGVAGAADFARRIGAQVSGDRIAVTAGYETNVPGLFAAGDCVNDIKQISMAVGSGAVCAMNIIKYLRSK